jgi:hypothetical protein
LGPGLEYADIGGFEDPDGVAISEKTFLEIQRGLLGLFKDNGIPEELRRAALEASVHAPQDWHNDAIHHAFSSDDESWRLSAVFCMGFVPGFHDQILEALRSGDEDIHFEAVLADGNWE